ncbi:MAG: biotin/lipoate A/B protein ligase family protein [bacterium]
MSSQWRYIIEKNLEGKQGLATDEMLISSVARSNLPILHLYSYKKSALIGRYQDMENALNLKMCKKLKVEYNRRITGGGTVLMDKNQLALGFAISLKNGIIPKSIKGVFNTMAEVLNNALKKIGITACFQPKNDLEVNSKKIAGLSAILEQKDILLFHTSLLLDFNFSLMLKILNLPPLKIKDKGISCFTDRMTTIKKEIGKSIELDEIIKLVIESFEKKFNIKLYKDSFSDYEKKERDRLIKEKYTNPKWLYCIKTPFLNFGKAIKKTNAGLIQVDITLNKKIIENIFITGDIIPQNPEIINKIEFILKWSSADKDKVKEKLKEVMKSETIYALDSNSLTNIIMQAVKNYENKYK